MEQSPRGEMSDDIQAQMEGVIHLEPLPLRREESSREQAMEEAAGERLFLLSFLEGWKASEQVLFPFSPGAFHGGRVCWLRACLQH